MQLSNVRICTLIIDIGPEDALRGFGGLLTPPPSLAIRAVALLQSPRALQAQLHIKTTRMGSLHVIVVGAGCFGVSTAVHLLQENGSSGPNYTVTVIDASDTIPAPDAASTDINKIVRSSYSDPFYTSFARAAMREWTSLGDVYHE